MGTRLIVFSQLGITFNTKDVLGTGINDEFAFIERKSTGKNRVCR
jgi:hypothetical protein